MTALLLGAAWSALLLVAARASRRRVLPLATDRIHRPRPDLTATPRRGGGVREVVLGPLARHRQATHRRSAVEAAAPDLVDLFAVAVASGLNVRLAAIAVSDRAPPGPLRDELCTVTDEVAAGARLADALERLPDRIPGSETVRSLVAALVDAERYGTALGPTLDRLAAEARRARHRRAEEAARRIPVQLLFPLVTCILPAFGLLTVAPLIAGGLRALRL